MTCRRDRIVLSIKLCSLLIFSSRLWGLIFTFEDFIFPALVFSCLFGLNRHLIPLGSVHWLIISIVVWNQKVFTLQNTSTLPQLSKAMSSRDLFTVPEWRVPHLRVNSDKVQNVGWGQDLDHLRTPLIWTSWGHIVTVPKGLWPHGWIWDQNQCHLISCYTNMLHWAEYEGNLFFQVLAFFGPNLKWLLNLYLKALCKKTLISSEMVWNH